MSDALAGAAHRQARLSGPAKDILEAYQAIQDASLATVAGEIRNSNVLISYFAIRRSERDKILGAEQIRSLLKSNEPLHRAAAAPAATQGLGPKASEFLIPLLRDGHPAVLEAALDAMEDGTSRTETGKALLEALPRFPTAIRHRAMRLMGKLKYRPAVGPLEEIFRRRDNTDSPVACEVLAAILGRSFLDGITEYLYPDNPLELHTAILECMAENPAPVYFAKATQLLKTLRHKQAIVEVVRRLALWSNSGVDLAITLLGSADTHLADAAQEGLIRHLRATATLPAGFLHRLVKPAVDQDGPGSATAQVPMPPRIEAIDGKLTEIFSSNPDHDFQQLFFMALTSEKYFLKPKLVQMSAARWGEVASKSIDAALQLSKDDAGLLRMRLQNRWAARAEQQSQSMMLARIVESVGAADLKSPVKEIARHLDTPILPVQMATVGALSDIGGGSEAAEIEKKIAKAHWMLKRKMAQALAKLTHENPSAGLFKLCEDSEPLVRIAAVRALEGIRHEKAYNILLKSLVDPDERVRSSACVCLREFAERREVQEKLFEMLQDTDARVRANTIESLEVVLSRDPNELRFRLKPFLADPNARVVINAAKALLPQDPDTSMSLLEKYLRAPDANLRAGALWALGHLRRPDTFLCLHFHSLQEKDPYVRGFVDQGIACMRDHLFYRDARYLLVNTQTGG